MIRPSRWMPISPRLMAKRYRSTRSSMRSQNLACACGAAATRRCISCSEHMLGHCEARSGQVTSAGGAAGLSSLQPKHIESNTCEYTSAKFAVPNNFKGPCTAFRLCPSWRSLCRHPSVNGTLTCAKAPVSMLPADVQVRLKNMPTDPLRGYGRALYCIELLHTIRLWLSLLLSSLLRTPAFETACQCLEV